MDIEREREKPISPIYQFTAYLLTAVGARLRLKPRAQSQVPTWVVAGAQSLTLSLLPLGSCMTRKLESEPMSEIEASYPDLGGRHLNC